MMGRVWSLTFLVAGLAYTGGNDIIFAVFANFRQIFGAIRLKMAGAQVLSVGIRLNSLE